MNCYWFLNSVFPPWTIFSRLICLLFPAHFENHVDRTLAIACICPSLWPFLKPLTAFFSPVPYSGIVAASWQGPVSTWWIWMEWWPIISSHSRFLPLFSSLPPLSLFPDYNTLLNVWYCERKHGPVTVPGLGKLLVGGVVASGGHFRERHMSHESWDQVQLCRWAEEESRVQSR